MWHQVKFIVRCTSIFLLTTFLFFSCNQQDKIIVKNRLSREDSLRDQLIGKWGGVGENTPVWRISRDSIYYYDHSAAYAYKILHGDFIISFPEHKVVFKDISVIMDTMFFIDVNAHTHIRGYRIRDLEK